MTGGVVVGVVGVFVDVVGAGFVEGAAVEGAAEEGAAEEDDPPPPPQAPSSTSKQNKKLIRMNLPCLSCVDNSMLRAGRAIPSRYCIESDKR